MMTAHDWLPVFDRDSDGMRLRGYVLKARVVALTVGRVLPSPTSGGTTIWLCDNGSAGDVVWTAEDLVAVFDRMVPKEQRMPEVAGG